jgi:hypothetical protein
MRVLAVIDPFRPAYSGEGDASCIAGRLGGWKTIYKTTLLGSDDLDSVARTGRLGRLRLAALTLAHGVISLSRVLLGSFEHSPA